MKNYKGMSLIEVLICLCLLSFALVTLQKVEFDTLQSAQTNYYFTQAMYQVSNVIENLKIQGKYADLTAIQDHWNSENHDVLPHGKGEISGDYPRYTIKLHWGLKQTPCEETSIGVSGCIKEEIQL